MMSQLDSTAAITTEARFEPTHWTSIQRAANDQVPGAQEALEQLCKTYWPPLYAFLRKQGRGPEDAKDLTQGFFLHLLSRNRLQSVQPEKGRFRSFLLAALTNYVRNQWDKQRASKRGGREVPLPFEIAGGEATTCWEPSDNKDPAKAFERAWASTLLAEVLQRLEAHCARQGKAEMFDALRPFLTGEADHGGYATAALRLRMSEGAARTAATRLRMDYRRLLRAEVAKTVSSETEVDQELSDLIAALRPPG
jgi:RNA polymerase sigma factor (sigma-70 family)